MFKSRPSTSCQAETSPSLRKKSFLLAVQIYLQQLKLSPDAKFDMEDLNPIMYPQEVARLLDILIDFVCFNKELIHACIEIVKVLPKYFHGIPKLLKITYKLCSKKIALCIPEKEANIKWDHVQNFGLIMAELYNMHLITSIPIFMWLDKVLKFILIDDAEESCLMVFKRCAIKLEKEHRKAFKKYEAACISLQLENRQTHLTEASDKCIETNAKENIETAWTYLMEMEIEFSPPNRDYENPMKLKDYAKSLIKETYSHPDQAESCADIFINRYNKNSSDTSALRDAIASLCDSEIQKIVDDANGTRNVDQAFGTFNFTAEMFKQRYLNTGIALKILRALYKLASSDCNQTLCLLLVYLKLTNKAYVTRTGAFPIEIFVFLEKQEENQRISRLSRDCIRNLLSNIKMQFCEKLEFLDKWPEIMSPNVNVVLCNSTVFSDIIAQLTTSNEEEILDKLLSLHFPKDCRPFVTVFASKAIESPEMSSLILNLCQKIPTEYHKYLDPETFTRDLKSFLLAEIKKELKNYQQNENEATFDRITRIIICMSEFASRDPSYVNPLIEQANIVLGFERSKKHATLFILLELVAAIKTFNGQIYSTQASNQTLARMKTFLLQFDSPSIELTSAIAKALKDLENISFSEAVNATKDVETHLMQLTPENICNTKDLKKISNRDILRKCARILHNKAIEYPSLASTCANILMKLPRLNIIRETRAIAESLCENELEAITVSNAWMNAKGLCCDPENGVWNDNECVMQDHVFYSLLRSCMLLGSRLDYD